MPIDQIELNETVRDSILKEYCDNFFSQFIRDIYSRVSADKISLISCSLNNIVRANDINDCQESFDDIVYDIGENSDFFAKLNFFYNITHIDDEKLKTNYYEESFYDISLMVKHVIDVSSRPEDVGLTDFRQAIRDLIFGYLKEKSLVLIEDLAQDFAKVTFVNNLVDDSGVITPNFNIQPFEGHLDAKNPNTSFAASEFSAFEPKEKVMRK